MIPFSWLYQLIYKSCHFLEINSFGIEFDNKQTVSQITKAMLVHAHLSINFFYFTLDYALFILFVLPPKNQMGEKGLRLGQWYFVYQGVLWCVHSRVWGIFAYVCNPNKDEWGIA